MQLVGLMYHLLSGVKQQVSLASYGRENTLQFCKKILDDELVLTVEIYRVRYIDIPKVIVMSFCLGIILLSCS